MMTKGEEIRKKGELIAELKYYETKRWKWHKEYRWEVYLVTRKDGRICMHGITTDGRTQEMTIDDVIKKAKYMEKNMRSERSGDIERAATLQLKDRYLGLDDEGDSLLLWRWDDRRHLPETWEMRWMSWHNPECINKLDDVIYTLRNRLGNMLKTPWPFNEAYKQQYREARCFQESLSF